MGNWCGSAQVQFYITLYQFQPRGVEHESETA